MIARPERFTNYLDDRRLPYTAVDVRPVGDSGVVMALAQHAPSPGQCYPPVGDLILSVVQCSSYDEVVRDVGLGRQTFKDAPSRILVTPANTPLYWSFAGTPRVLHIAFPWHDVRAFFETHGGQVDACLTALAHEPFEDPLLSATAWRLWLAAASREPAADLFGEHAINMLLAALLMRGTGSDAVAGPRSLERLTPAQVRRACDYMTDRLADSVRLIDLAALVGLSPFHFARAFKGTTGHTPHQWFMTRRVERAKELMADSARSITDVALAVGFSSLAHFSSTFRRITGLAPAAWRREFGRSPG
jgi:AraC family transcriptional regulator